MYAPSPRTITKETLLKNIMKMLLKKLKFFIKIYSINVRKRRKGRIEEQKIHEPYDRLKVSWQK